MTIFEQKLIESWNAQGITANKPKKGTASDESVAAATGTFAEALIETTAGTKVPCSPSDVDPDTVIPEKWGTDDMWGFVATITSVTKFLKDYCDVDTSKRKPTHEITDEQREWLASRHDLEAIGNSTRTETPDFAELMGDLVYLNIMSRTDVFELMAPALPLPEGQTGQLIYMDDYDNFPDEIDLILERIKKFIEMQRHEVELNSSSWSVDYIKRTHEFLKTKETCCELLSSLLSPVMHNENVSEFKEERNVTDASGQLRVDFGTLLA